MKKLAVTIKLEMVVPADWELVTTSEGTEVLKLPDGRFLDLTFEPMVTTEMEENWTNEVDEAFMDDLLEMVESEDVSYELTSASSH